MAKVERDIGLEILEGLRELKRGEHGRVTTLPSVQKIREKARREAQAGAGGVAS